MRVKACRKPTRSAVFLQPFPSSVHCARPSAEDASLITIVLLKTGGNVYRILLEKHEPTLSDTYDFMMGSQAVLMVLSQSSNCRVPQLGTKNL